MASKAVKSLKNSRVKPKPIRVKTTYEVVIIQHPKKYDGISLGRAVIAADVIYNS